MPNPSQLFLAERPTNVPGSSVLCTIEGSRPILVEVQALVSASTFGNARRTASGLDHNRLSLLLAVLDKRVGLNLATDDVFVNVAGGMEVDRAGGRSRGRRGRRVEPAQPRRFAPDVVVFGEVGLAGEVRATSQAALARPRSRAARLHTVRHARGQPRAGRRAEGARRLSGVRTVGDALDALL